MSRTNVLVVEGNADDRELLRRALACRRGKTNVRFASTGEEAVRNLQDLERPLCHCLVLDYNLPTETAAELLPRIRAVGCACPAIVISSSNAQDIVIKSMRSGSVDFLTKAEAFQDDNLWTRINAAVTEARRKEETRRKIERRARDLTALAERDPLTGLFNRRSLDRLFDHQRQLYDRRGSTSAIMLDIDRFKRINDEHGHLAGDKVLRAVANVIRGCAEESDTTCRYAGEEFVLIQPKTTCAQAFCRAEELRTKIEQLVVSIGPNRIPVTTSAGVVNCRSEQLSPETIMQADQAMYLAKTRGRNQVCIWPMVALDQMILEIVSDSEEPALTRLNRLIRRMSGRLGTTQKIHLTTHAEYVSKVAVRLGQALGMGKMSLGRLREAGLCHDLGKCIIPEEMLSKPSTLSKEEAVVMALHAVEGAEAAERLGVDPLTADYIRFHHARFGEGGPAQGPGGKAIPLGARILAVVDALVTMTSQRSYESVRSFTSAVGELQRGSGTQFDPEVVAAVPHALLADVPLFDSRKLES